MLTANDHDRANRMIIAPASTTGAEQASAHQAISHKSVGMRLLLVAAPEVAAAPHRLQPMCVTEFGPQSLHMHRHRRQVAKVPAPHLLQQFLAGEHGVGVSQEEQQQVELAVRQDTGCPATVTDRAAVDTLKSPTVTSSGNAARRWERRSTDRTRSASSRGLNGLVR